MLDQIRHLLTFADTPLYNIKVVVGKTGVNVSTLRAWERRYGIPTPKRSDRGHRLYSPRDVAILTWMREQVEQGMTVHQAVSLLEQAQTPSFSLNPSLPTDAIPAKTSRPLQTTSQPVANDLLYLQEQLFQAFLQFDLRQAHTLTNQAFAVTSPNKIMEQLFAPVMRRLGDDWARGKLSVIVEHAATNFVRQRILALMQQNAPFCIGPRIVCGCVPGEHHEIGLLMFSLLLQQHGWDVIYLGQSVTIDGLEASFHTIMPSLVCFTASLAEHVPGLIEIGQIVERSQLGAQAFVYSGRIFLDQPDLAQHVPGTFLGHITQDALETCTRLAQQSMEFMANRARERSTSPRRSSDDAANSAKK